jgi:single-strand DNA-binding protein
MAGETIITVIGNLTADPELRFTPASTAVSNFTVATTPRIFNSATGEWKDGETLFLRCNAWRDLGEHVAESLTRGARVIVQGRLKQRSFDTKDGENRTVFELDVDEVGPSLKYATTKVTKVSKNAEKPQAKAAPAAAVAEDDPWGTPAEADLVGAGAGFASPPPF